VTALYSANYGAWDPPRQQPVPVQMFTESDHPLATTARYLKPGYQHVGHSHPGQNSTQNRLDAKWWKCRPDLACPDEEITVWLDSSVTILTHDFADICKAALGRADALLMRHPWRDCIYSEATASRVAGLEPKYGGQPISEQVEHYRAQGHPEHWGLVQTTVMVRRDNRRTRALNEAWWNEITHWSIQDQLSLPPLLRTMDVRWKFWKPGLIEAKHIRWGAYN